MKTKKKTFRRPWRFHTGETVKAALKRKGMNPNQLWPLVGCSHQSAYQWRDGVEPLSIFQVPLAAALGVEAKP